MASLSYSTRCTFVSLVLAIILTNCVIECQLDRSKNTVLSKSVDTALETVAIRRSGIRNGDVQATFRDGEVQARFLGEAEERRGRGEGEEDEELGEDALWGIGTTQRQSQVGDFL